ncbi:hypothetical protein HAX54_052966 [Datura stramonium]|uniref:Uncharacterized protein n=1 Tax=Datura stramonium TaxID=4076 RepID=A0ABS8SZP4_DATST|nr:hypothetical protein [Datura stramonium]
MAAATILLISMFLITGLVQLIASAAPAQHQYFLVEEASFERLKLIPGPTIYARSGETVLPDIQNKGTDNISISWHLKSDPRTKLKWLIQPGTSISRNITVSDDEDGTLWWHAKDVWQSATVHGVLLVHPKPGGIPYPYAAFPIILGEWWKKDFRGVVNESISSGGTIADSDAFTINGQPGDLYPCSKNETFKIEVEAGKSYLVRIVNAAVGKTYKANERDGVCEDKCTTIT